MCPAEEILALCYCCCRFDTNGKLFEDDLERLMWTESFHAIFKQRGPSAAKGSAPFVCQNQKYAGMSREPTGCR